VYSSTGIFRVITFRKNTWREIKNSTKFWLQNLREERDAEIRYKDVDWIQVPLDRVKLLGL
jgi:hypothetical protein